MIGQQTMSSNAISLPYDAKTCNGSAFFSIRIYSKPSRYRIGFFSNANATNRRLRYSFDEEKDFYKAIW